MSLASSMSSNIQLNTINANKDIKNLKTKSPLCNTKSISIKEFATSSSKNVNYHKMAKNNSIQRNKSLLNNNIDKDELRKKIKETLKSKRNKYKIKKKYTKVDGKESPCDSNNNSYDRINSNEINNNINIDKIINTTIQNKEKTKLQLFYSEHLTKHKNNKNISPKINTEKKISNNDTLSKNSKSTINNNDYDSSIVDMGTNHDTIDNRKKKSFVCPTKNKKEKKHIIKNLAHNDKKKK